MNHRTSGIDGHTSRSLHGTQPLLSLDAVGFTYPDGRQAVSDLSLELGPGIVGLLGPNGAGKSTLMRMLATLTRPRCGSIRWNGSDIAPDFNPLRKALGYLPQEFGVYPYLTAREFLSYLSAIKGLPHAGSKARVDECLELVGLSGEADRPLGGFSGGMRQRIGIAQALLNDPMLLIVDEPTVGLDPAERLRFRHLLTDLAGKRLIILSTHIVSDIEASATDLVVLHAGRKRFHGTPDALIEAATGSVWDWLIPAADLEQVRKDFHVCGSLRRGDSVRVRVIALQAPSPGAEAVVPGLEEAYAHLLAQQPAGKV